MRLLYILCVFCALSVTTTAQRTRTAKPVVTRPRSARRYTTVLTVDGGGMRCIIPSIIAQEIENSIKRHLLANPQYLPDDAEISSVDDFDVLLADFFDAMSGVSGGSWVTGYLASKGGNGASEAVFSNRRIRRRYGPIIPGQAKGLEVFFMEYGDTFYPGGIRFNITPPAATPDLVGGISNLSSLVNPAALGALIPSIEIPGLTAPFFPVEGLEETLDLFLGDVKLSDLSTFYVVHAYDLLRRQNLYFVHDDTARRAITFTSHTVTRNEPRPFPDENARNAEYLPDNEVNEGLDFYMKDVLRASSAVPGFHEAKMMTPVDQEDIVYNLIDGAAVTNNPSLQALIFLATEPNLIAIRRIAMISLGTGLALLDLEGNTDASVLGWLINNELLSISTDGSAENVQSQVDFLFYGTPGVVPGQYLRVQVTAERNTTDGEALTRVTEPNDLPIFQRIAEEAIERYREAIDRFVAEFIFS